MHAAQTQCRPSARPVVPRLSCPFPPAIHLAAGRVNARSLAFAGAARLTKNAEESDRLERACIGSLPARAFPAGAEAGLQLASDWTVLFCAIDDEVERLATAEAAA